MLTAIQKDALTEMLNVQLGASASILSEMVNQKIVLSVPELELKQGFELDSFHLNKQYLFGVDDVILTTLTFGTEFEGNATVMFPQDKASILVNACLGNAPAESQNTRLSYEDVDVIKEICNVILNSLIGDLGNRLEVKLEYSSFETGFSIELLEDNKMISKDTQVLVLYTSFFLTKSQIKGVILIALSVPSFDMLIERIDGMLREIDD
jgi:chemotaxis protein CheC